MGVPRMQSHSLAEPGDHFGWYLQVCTFWCGRATIYPGPFGIAYGTTLCIVCQKRRRGAPRPYWYIETAADLPRIGETAAEWEARKKAAPGTFG